MRSYLLSVKPALSLALVPSRRDIAASYQRSLLLIWAISIIGLLLYAFPRLLIISGSMAPTIPVGKIIVANRIGYLGSAPKRGDIAVFRPIAEFSATQWSHRIIGLPGDIVSIRNGHVTVNGQAIEYDATTDPDFGDIVVPKGYYYEKGDNLEAINGLVPKSAVIGKIIVY